MKNKGFRKAFTSIDLNKDDKDRMLQGIYQKKKQKKRRQMIALAAGILVLITSFLLLQEFLDWGGQDSLHGDEEKDEEMVEDEDDRDKDEEVIEEPKEEDEDEDLAEEPDEEEIEEPEDEKYITFEIPPDPGGMGDPMFLVDDLSELELKLQDSPLSRNLDIDELQELGIESMPVFINPVPTGMPGMYTPEEYEEIQSILTEIAKKLGLEVAEKDNSSITLENGLQIFMTPNLEIYISNVGYPENINRESFQEKNVEEAMEFYQEYYYPMVSDLLNYQSPQRELSYRIDDNNRLSSSVTYVETAENPIEQFFHDQFNQTRFGYSASNYSEGDLLDPPRISIPYYHLEPFEVLDEIPLRSLEYIVEERKGREIFGQELKLEHIVRAEVFYYSYTTARYLSPIYRLYIHIEDPDENYESEEGQMLIVPIEVLAIPEEYEQ